MTNEMYTITAIAPVNIAVIKYWGKRDEELILPTNDSLSATLSTDQLCAKTTIAASPQFTEHRMWLNGEVTDFEQNPRLLSCWTELKEIASKTNRPFPLDWKLHICSENNFPTAAGLASSAAGYACFIYTLAKLYDIDDIELSAIARRGSGSACRSIYGGFVQWIKGETTTGEDSIARQIQPSSYWPEIRVLILVVNDTRKKTSSTKGMRNSVLTSDLLSYRATECVPRRIREITDAINTKNFTKFAEITMKDSNQFHAICLDTYPPCVYMNDLSHEIVHFVHKYNELNNEIRVAYTFDAGPNACLYLRDQHVPDVLRALNQMFPHDEFPKCTYIKGLCVDLNDIDDQPYRNKLPTIQKNCLKYIIHTAIGDGPKMLSNNESLLNELGLPKRQ